MIALGIYNSLGLNPLREFLGLEGNLLEAGGSGQGQEFDSHTREKLCIFLRSPYGKPEKPPKIPNSGIIEPGAAGS